MTTNHLEHRKFDVDQLGRQWGAYIDVSHQYFAVWGYCFCVKMSKIELYDFLAETPDRSPFDKPMELDKIFFDTGHHVPRDVDELGRVIQKAVETIQHSRDETDGSIFIPAPIREIHIPKLIPRAKKYDFAAKPYDRPDNQSLASVSRFFESLKHEDD